MKKIILTIIIIITFSFIAMSQNIIDNNTEEIQKYFFNNQIKNEIINSNINIESNIYQRGENNSIEIESSGKKIQLVRQVGDDNNYQYYTYYDSSTANLIINQFGDENDIQIFGQNSIVEKLKITQTTNNQSILIINF